MGVHDASRQLDQFTDMPHQQRGLKALQRRDIQTVSDEVGDLDCGKFRELRILPQQKIHAVVARYQDQLVAEEPCLSGLHRDRVHDGLLAHRLYDAGGPQDRDAPLDPQHGIEGFLCDGIPAGR